MTLFATAPPPPECAVCHAAYEAWLAGGADEAAWWEEAASGDADVFGDSPTVEASSGDASALAAAARGAAALAAAVAAAAAVRAR